MPADSTPRPLDLAEVPAAPGAAKPDAILVADNITRQFGGLMAVNVAHLEVQRSAITALIGPNGAGKTTFFNLLTGFDRPQTGEWTFDGRRLTGLPAHRVARRGMVRTFQLTKALSRLTVLDNMRLGAAGQRGERMLGALLPWLWRSEEREVTERAERLLERFKLAQMRDEFAGTLSGGQRKLLELARALMSQPAMVMLDEPMAGVNPALKQSLLGHIRDVRAEGTTVLFVEHDMDMVRDISDWVVVMAAGQVIAESPPQELAANRAVVDAYLGRHHNAPLTREEEQLQLDEADAEIAGETPAVRRAAK